MLGMSREEVHLAKAYNKLYFSIGAEIAGAEIAGTGAAPGDGLENPADEEIFDLEPKTVPQEYLDEIKTPVSGVGSTAPDLPASSEFMLGHTSMAVIMPESDPMYGTQDWTPEEEERAVEEAISAMDWWARHSPGQSLRISYEFNYRVPISLEPLDVGGMQSEEQWASESLVNLGYSGTNRFAMAYQYIDDLRTRYSSDWGFLVFILHGRPGQAFGRALAYAYLGGPYNVNAYSNGRLGTDDLDRVIAHETGHTFYTLDEYSSAPITCMVKSGYLHVENANKQEGEPGCKSDVPCVMRGSGQDVPFHLVEPCYYTLGQVGWWDTDGDGVPDVLDRDPVIESVVVVTDGAGTVASGDTLHSTSVSFSGLARARPIPNRNPSSGIPGRGFTVAHAGAEYRVDGGEWTLSDPSDGWFDSPLEPFNFTVPDLSPWSWHTVEVRAVTGDGVATPDSLVSSFEWYVDPDPVGMAAVRLATSNPAKPPVSISFAPVHPSGVGGLPVPVEVAVFDPVGRKIAVLESGRFESGRYHTTEWDGADINGSQVPAGVYMVAMTSQGQKQANKVLMIP
jgi:hypothetical protein